MRPVEAFERLLSFPQATIIYKLDLWDEGAWSFGCSARQSPGALEAHSVHVVTAGRGDVLARDPAARLLGQEGHHLRDVVHRVQPVLQRRRLLLLRDQRRRDLVRHLGLDGAWSHRVHWTTRIGTRNPRRRERRKCKGSGKGELTGLGLPIERPRYVPVCPLSHSSAAQQRVMASSPALLAAYSARPPTDPILMMRERGARCASTACVSSSAPRRLTSQT